MSSFARKSSRSTGISNVKSRNLSIDGESKTITGTFLISPVLDVPKKTITKRPSIVENVSILVKPRDVDGQDLPSDHSKCNQLFLDLQFQIEILKKEILEQKSEINTLLVEMSALKQEKEDSERERAILANDNDTLVSSNSILEKNFTSLSEEILSNKVKWQAEKELLETALNEIRKELEAKIIEIRAKHREEVLDLEEKNRLLKVRLSDNLKINSWERQQEIDRISKDLDKSLANEGNMRTQLNKIITQKKGESLYCLNCHTDLVNSSSRGQQKFGKSDARNTVKGVQEDSKERRAAPKFTDVLHQ